MPASPPTGPARLRLSASLPASPSALHAGLPACPAARPACRVPVLSAGPPPPAAVETAEALHAHVPDVPVIALGHSDQPKERFLETLRAHGVQALVDIRRHPGSRRVPWAGRDVLPGLLEEHGIQYLHEPDLGGRRRPAEESVNTAWRSASFRGYADHMQSTEFVAALERLIEMAADGPVAIMCAEAVPWRCHRRLVADALLARGVEVVQAFSPTDARPHEMTDFAKVQDGQVVYPAGPEP